MSPEKTDKKTTKKKDEPSLPPTNPQPPLKKEQQDDKDEGGLWWLMKMVKNFKNFLDNFAESLERRPNAPAPTGKNQSTDKSTDKMVLTPPNDPVSTKPDEKLDLSSIEEKDEEPSDDEENKDKKKRKLTI